MRRSTRNFIHEGFKQEGYSFFDFLHGYVYARWPYLYIGIAVGEHPLARAYLALRSLGSRQNRDLRSPDEQNKGMADTYHGKVLLPEAAHALVQVQENIELRNLEHVIPYPAARDIVLKNPDHVVVLECPCRSVREVPCLPLDVCLIIGEPFANFVLEHHPERSKRITRSQAIRLLEQERDRGHVHHAFFKDAMLGRFYAICNCCSCCCGAIQATRSGSPMISSSGYLVRIDTMLCAGCGSCHQVCNFSALIPSDQATVVIESRCMGCGLCVAKCPEGALVLERDPGKGTPLEISALLEQAQPTSA